MDPADAIAVTARPVKPEQWPLNHEDRTVGVGTTNRNRGNREMTTMQPQP